MDLPSETTGDIVIISPAGRIDHNSAEVFTDAIVSHVDNCAESNQKAIIDMSGVTYMSSVGLRALMIAAKRSKELDVQIVVAGMQPEMKEIFEISRFHLIFDTYASVFDATTELSQ
ncbi:MAG: STAS domain-containing protein [Rhodospirillaceae bacterium]|nr:STAS domain-containing protein [Rhodospirillales bacterium]MBT3904874.1 STAS domain-containing protein [Rhodospirillaceae bacterium]MBT4702322.1 STAS domain-containing protein [Rhodospirillaceae bacterium]MBT5034466.1 STAS domain-containing protein [Rhodospirillaceae bacterium]MBT6220112.1 STAS domain-containing protein [Rhodospirillaceae bacterium]